MDQIYKKNLAALAKASPELFRKLSAVKENLRYQVFMGKDPIDINILDTRAQTPLYNEPVGDTVEKLKAINPYGRYPFLCFFGIGNGIFFKAVLDTPGFQHIVVVEPELELLFIALNFADLSAHIESGKIILYHAEDFNKREAIRFASLPDVGVYIKLYDLHLTTPYYGLFQEEVIRVNKIFVEGVLQFVRTQGNDATDSLIGVEHFVRNLPEMVANPTFKALCESPCGQLAVVVSTGPSLTKQLPLLKKIAPYVTIISVDASFPVLYKHGIKPDIVTSLERIELTSKFFKEVPAAFHRDVVFVHSALQHRAVVENSFGTKVIAMRPFGYMQYYELDDYGYAGIGMSAANLAYEVAFHMGHKRTVLIGQDLAYGDDGTTHAADHAFGKEDEAFKKNVEKMQEGDVILPRYGGEGTVRSNPIWLMFLNYFITNIADAGGIMETINATEGGARIEGAVEMSFAQVAERYVDRTQPKTRLEPALPSREERKAARETVLAKTDEMLSYGEEVRQKVEALFVRVAEECANLEKLNQLKRLDLIDFGRIDGLLAEIDGIKKIFDEGRFRRMFWETIRSYIVHQELDLAKIVVRDVKDDESLKARNVEFLMAHRFWLYSLAGGIVAQLDAVKRAREAAGF